MSASKLVGYTLSSTKFSTKIQTSNPTICSNFEPFQLIYVKPNRKFSRKTKLPTQRFVNSNQTLNPPKLSRNPKLQTNELGSFQYLWLKIKPIFYLISLCIYLINFVIGPWFAFLICNACNLTKGWWRTIIYCKITTSFVACIHKYIRTYTCWKVACYCYKSLQSRLEIFFFTFFVFLGSMNMIKSHQ